MTTRDQEKTDDQRREEAAGWHVRMHSGAASSVDIEAHMEWLLAHPENAISYENVCAKLAAVDRGESRIRREFAGEFDLSGPRGFDRLKALFAPRFSGPRLAGLAAAAAVLLFLVYAPISPFSTAPYVPQAFSTEDGAVRRIELRDGSWVSLDAQSAILVEFGPDDRRLTLAKGRAFFSVASDADRPFIVRAGTHEVTVVGTKFEVTSNPTLASVTVSEGRVAVRAIETLSDSAPRPEIVLKAGFNATFGAGEIEPVIREVDTSRLAAWRNGQLIFDATPLAEVVAAINLYFPRRPITIADAGLREMKFSGVLKVSDPTTMARQISQFLDINYELTQSGVILKSE